MPGSVERFWFPLTSRAQVLEVDIDKEKHGGTYLLQEGSELIISHQSKEIRISKGAPVSVKAKSKKR